MLHEKTKKLWNQDKVQTFASSFPKNPEALSSITHQHIESSIDRRHPWARFHCGSLSDIRLIPFPFTIFPIIYFQWSIKGVKDLLLK